jgi:hypothetical protein
VPLTHTIVTIRVLSKEEKDITYRHRRRAQTIGIPDVVTGIQTEHKSVLSFNYLSFVLSHTKYKKRKRKKEENLLIS